MVSSYDFNAPRARIALAGIAWGLCLGLAAAQAQTKTIPVTIRDFSAAHADFESPQCFGGKNMVQSTLDADRKPWHNAANICPDNHLADWFRDAPDNKRYCREAILTHKAGTENIFTYDNDFYFPIDDVPSREFAIPGEDGKQHNFHFCMEMHAAFKYRGGEVFDFKGDDDVWVYVNRQLALDLGGVHTPQAGTVDLDAMRSQLAIAPGNYYDFDFFFCERQTIGSHLWLSTSIDIIPPPAPGYHIADADLNLYHAGDTVILDESAGARLFKAAEISTRNETIDCSDVSSQVKSPVDGDWTFAGVPLPHGPQASIDPAAYPSGTYPLKLGKGGIWDSVWVVLTHKPLPRAVRGWYLDRDGDGRIETAMILFDSPLTQPPSDVTFTNPFNLSQVEKGPSAVAEPHLTTAMVEPFSPGTGFPAAELGHIGAQPGAFAAQNVVMEDSVGAVLIGAVAFPPVGLGRAALEVEFSEPVSLDPTLPGFPFDIKRAGIAQPSEGFQATGMTRISPTRFRFEFAAETRYPVPRDSLRISLTGTAVSGLADLHGNRSRMAFFIPVAGDPVRGEAAIGISLVQGVTSGKPVGEGPAGAGIIVLHAGGVCINCRDAGISGRLPAVPTDSDGFRALGPTWRVTSKFPFRFAFTVFDNLGQFVNRAEGSVPADRLALIPRGGGPDDSARVEMTLLPRAADGNALATGAYILKGRVDILDQPVYQGPQGEDVLIIPVGRSLVSRFGYVRER